MSLFRLDIVASLARQLAFAPHDVRLEQLAAAETLMGDLDVARSYPAEFVTFRVTGYHPKAQVTGEELTGLALQHDLGLLIERVSEGLDLRSTQQPEPVLSIDDVTERLNVTSKTIQRWRKKGLVSRRFIFADGKRRVGFLLSSIERFIARHSDVVLDGHANLTRVEDTECRAIVAAARRMIDTHRLDEHALSQRLARRFRRSALTVLHTLRKHDQERPTDAVLASAASPMRAGLRRKIVLAARHGRSLATISRRTRRSRTAIYRVVLQDRIDRLVKRRVKFHDDELYHTPDAADAIADIVRAADVAFDSQGLPESRPPRGLPPYLADLYRVPLLTSGQERALFLQFHFLKFCYVADRQRFDPESARLGDVERLEARLADAVTVKNRIVRANLRLVVSVARKHVRPAYLGSATAGPTLMELVSEGNLILMRAVESFDVHKNVRFSTYATFALMTGLARLAPALRSQTVKGGAMPVGELADPRCESDRAQHSDRDEVRQMLGRLDGEERRVIAMYYGLDEGGTVTFEQVGARLGLSKHRVRQIERSAMSKLRDAMGAN